MTETFTLRLYRLGIVGIHLDWSIRVKRNISILSFSFCFEIGRGIAYNHGFYNAETMALSSVLIE